MQRWKNWNVHSNCHPHCHARCLSIISIFSSHPSQVMTHVQRLIECCVIVKKSWNVAEFLAELFNNSHLGICHGTNWQILKQESVELDNQLPQSNAVTAEIDSFSAGAARAKLDSQIEPPRHPFGTKLECPEKMLEWQRPSFGVLGAKLCLAAREFQWKLILLLFRFWMRYLSGIYASRFMHDF